ncbi:hypothetical protein HDU86_002577 [Geranomyces michiganensis]|nr:hypothetical protein HDU86_002577 [Geranomyces michiganensis]
MIVTDFGQRVLDQLSVLARKKAVTFRLTYLDGALNKELPDGFKLPATHQARYNEGAMLCYLEQLERYYDSNQHVRMPFEMALQIVRDIGNAYSLGRPYIPAAAPIAEQPRDEPQLKQERPARAEFTEPADRSEYWHPEIAPSLQATTIFQRTGDWNALTNLVTTQTSVKYVHHMVVLWSSKWWRQGFDGDLKNILNQDFVACVVCKTALEMVEAQKFMARHSFDHLGMFTWFNSTGQKPPKAGDDNFHVRSFFYFMFFGSSPVRTALGYGARTLAYPAATQDGMSSKAKRDASGTISTIPIDATYTILLLMTGTSSYWAPLALVDCELLLTNFTRAAATRFQEVIVWSPATTTQGQISAAAGANTFDRTETLR